MYKKEMKNKSGRFIGYRLLS